MEIKIENRGTKYFLWGKKSTSILFFSMKMKMMDLWMQIEGRKLIFIVNFSVLDFFKFVSRMPHIAQILVSTFNSFQGNMPPAPPGYFLFFFFSNSRLCTNNSNKLTFCGPPCKCSCIPALMEISWKVEKKFSQPGYTPSFNCFCNNEVFRCLHVKFLSLSGWALKAFCPELRGRWSKW